MLIPLYSSPLLFLSARSFRSNLLVFHGHNPCQNIVICCLIKQKRRKNSFQFLIFDTQLAKLKHSTLDIHVGSFFSLTVKLFFSKISNQSECGSAVLANESSVDQLKDSLQSFSILNEIVILFAGEMITKKTFTPFF